MSFKNPFDGSKALGRGGCTCGHHETQHVHDAAARSHDQRLQRIVESAVVRAIFPHDATRRAFLSAKKLQKQVQSPLCYKSM